MEDGPVPNSWCDNESKFDRQKNPEILSNVHWAAGDDELLHVISANLQGF